MRQKLPGAAPIIEEIAAMAGRWRAFHRDGETPVIGNRGKGVSAATATIEGEEGAVAPVRRPRKKLLIIGGIVALLLIAGAVGAWLWFGKSDKEAAPKAEVAAEGGAAEGAAETFIEVPAMVVNLRSTDGAARLIKIRLMLVPANAEKGPAITAHLPLIIDSFQPFLRELRPEDLAGSAAVFRIKEELLIRANAMTGPGTVREVLVQDLIQQ
jgi:flagellar FliL protein